MNPRNPKIEEVLATITPRERELLKQRFGITISSNPTDEELSAMLDITRARIEEFEQRARNRLPDDDDPERDE